VTRASPLAPEKCVAEELVLIEATPVIAKPVGDATDAVGAARSIKVR
jgi:hypothetical protein